MGEAAQNTENNAPAVDIRKDARQQSVIIAPSGNWIISQNTELERIFQYLSADRDISNLKVTIDGSAVALLDAAGALILCRLAARGRERAAAELVNFSATNRKIIELISAGDFPTSELKKKRNYGLVQNIGAATITFWTVCLRICGFVGKACIETVKVAVDPRRFRVRELFVQLENVLVDAIPIAALVTFLIGIVVAYLFAIQVEKYGGNIFIVDAVGTAMMRELSPIIVAIIMAGRSGSAFTAQLGVMKINEEVDALTILGLSPFQVLIVPRLVALVLAMPLLVFVGDAVGIFGAMLIAEERLGITLPMFLERLGTMVSVRHLYIGLIKAPVFAAFIAIIGCNMGLAVESNARSVGDNTTATVVQSIVAVILLNAGFAVLFVQLGY